MGAAPCPSGHAGCLIVCQNPGAGTTFWRRVADVRGNSVMVELGRTAPGRSTSEPRAESRSGHFKRGIRWFRRLLRPTVCPWTGWCVARETRPPSSAVRGALPGRGHRRALALHGDPRVGAAEEAPTAPHATAPAPGAAKPGGPARFWDVRRIRIVLTVGLVLSALVHFAVWPWGSVSLDTGVTLKDVEGELAIPVDLLGEEEAPPEPAPPPKSEEPSEDDEGPFAAKKKPDAGPKPKPKPDAGAPVLGDDAGVPLSDFDAGILGGSDAGVPLAELDAGGIADGGGLVAFARADGGELPGAGGPRDPAAMLGAKSLVAAGQVNVTLRVNVARIRQHPMAPRVSSLLVRLPQWRDFLKGAPANIDPVRDVDDILIYGPSLIHTEKTLVIVRYSNISDAVVDTAVEGIASAYAGGGPFDVGVPGIKASLGHADQAERVFMRVKKGVLVVLPKADAQRLTPQLVKTDFSRKVAPNEAMRLTVKDPWKQISIRGLKFSNKLSEIRLWIVPDAKNEADVFGEGDCGDEASCTEIASDLTQTLERVNQTGVNLGILKITVSTFTRGLLDGAKVVPVGNKVQLRIHANSEQLEAIYNLLDQQLGGAPPP